MTSPASQKPEVKARREFYTEQIKDAKNHDALVLELTYLHDQVNSLKALNAQRLAPPEVVVNVTGGVVQGASSTRPVSLLVLDFDTDGLEDAQLLTVDDGQCEVIEHQVALDGDWIARVHQAIAARDSGQEGFVAERDGDEGAGQAVVPDTLTLYAVGGRLSGDDDDTVHMIWATDRDAASSEFKRLILEENGLEEPPEDRPIYETSLNSVCSAVRGKNGIASGITLSHAQLKGLEAAFDAHFPPAASAAQDTAPDVPK